jgi:putative beta-barrel porin MtrB/PioB
MKIRHQFMTTTLLALLLAPVGAFSQEAPARGYVELGYRGITGTVDGRTHPGEVPFSNGFRPGILFSGVNTYRDQRNSLFIPRSSMFLDKVQGTRSYFSLETANTGVAFEGSTLIRDNTILATFGEQGVYKLQVRYDQTPHIFSGTTRTLFTEASSGVWKFNGNRAALDAARVTGTAAALTTALAPQADSAVLFVQRNIRRNAGGLASWDIRPDWNLRLQFSRETQDGTRPHGMCFGNSPSCVWVEVPENLDYDIKALKAATDLARDRWEMQLGYAQQWFHNNTTSELVDDPFSNNVNSATVTANGQLSLYPSNQARSFQVAGAWHQGKLHFMSNIVPGWETQDDAFVPYTTNTFLLSQTGAAAPISLPVTSLDGERQTLAMNYTIVANAAKNIELVARYRHYDRNNNTEEHQYNPFVGDLAAEAQLAGPSGQIVKGFVGINGQVDPDCQGVCNEPYSFHTKDLELGGTWFFAKKSSAKLQYGRQWFDRTHRDVSQTIENIYKVAVDLRPLESLTLRLAGIRQNRAPQDRHYEWALMPGTQRPDQGFRIRNRADLLAQYDATSWLSVGSFFGTIQDDFNRRDSLSSLTPVGDPSLITVTTAPPRPIYGPYYIYGMLNDFGWNAGADFDVTVGPNVTIFAEYSRERNTNRMVQRQRSVNTASQVGCPSATVPQDCDPINDWMTASKDIVDSYYAGTDLTMLKKLHVSVSYGLAATKSTTLSDGVNCQIGNGPNDFCRLNFLNWRLDSAANRAVTFNFPENVTRLHEVSTIVKFDLTKNVVPKFEYRYQRFDDKDFQTSVMNPFAFVGPAIDPAGTTGLQRMLFLGADTPSYKAHVFLATLEYRF